MCRKLSIILTCFFFISCTKDVINSKANTKLDYKKKSKCNILKLVKVFETTEYYGGYCIPLNKRLLLITKKDRKSYNIKTVDYNSKVLKETRITMGEGPSDLLNIAFCGSKENKIFLLDGNKFIKAIDPTTHAITCLGRTKIKNKNHPLSSTGTFEYSNNGIVLGTTPEPTHLNNSEVIFLKSTWKTPTKWEILGKLRHVERTALRKSTKGRFYADLFMNAQSSPSFTINEQTNDLYSIPNIEKGEILIKNLDTQKVRSLWLEIDIKDRPIDKKAFELWKKWSLSAIPARFRKRTKFIEYEYEPLFRDIKIVKNFLIIITGMRKELSNIALIYELNSYKFMGTMRIPSPYLRRGDWINGYYITNEKIETSEDYKTKTSVYKMVEK